MRAFILLPGPALFFVVAASLVNANVFGDFEYEVNGKAVTITRYTGSSDYVEIPAIMDGKPVTTIGNEAFYSCSNLISITIPDSVTTIGDEAFYFCSSLTSITIPDSVTTIGEWAFYSCGRLASVTIPDSVTTIGEWAFAACSALTSITVDAQNPSFSSIDGVLYDKNKTTLIRCPGGKTGDFSIPDTVSTIVNGAFFHCQNLTSITIPDGVTTIGLGHNTFRLCPGLTSITVDALNPSLSSIDGVLFNKEKTTLIQYPLGKIQETYAIPGTVTMIGDAAFSGCMSLTSVTISESVTTIGQFSFYLCYGLTKFEVDPLNLRFSSVDGVLYNKEKTSLLRYPESKIGGAFMIPDSVTSIEQRAFIYCKGLTSIRIPENVISIGDHAFAQCNSLTSIYFAGEVPEVRLDGWNLFSGNKDLTIYYIAGKNGWAETFGGQPTALWELPVDLQFTNLTQQHGVFSFTISGTNGQSVRVEACNSLAEEEWLPIGTYRLTDGSLDFSDPESPNYPERYYRATALVE
jgi:hypothetical protein